MVRTISEIIAIHRTEPSIRDIYVEGNCDLHLLNWFIQETGKNGVTVIDIGLIEVPDTVILQYGLNLNCRRSKVISLAYELENAGITKSTVICLVDLDMQPFFPLFKNASLLSL